MTTGKQLFTTLESDGTLTLAIEEVTFPEPKGNKVLVKMEAAPINPSDLAILTGAADFENAEYSPGKVVAKMPEPFNSARNRGTARSFLQVTKVPAPWWPRAIATLRKR